MKWRDLLGWLTPGDRRGAAQRAGWRRRDFLRAALLGTAAAATLDVEQLLWTPDEKTIVLPETIKIPSFDDVVHIGVDRGYDEQTGISMRFIKKYTIRADRFPARLDVLYGVGCIEPGRIAIVNCGLYDVPHIDLETKHELARSMSPSQFEARVYGTPAGVTL